MERSSSFRRVDPQRLEHLVHGNNMQPFGCLSSRNFVPLRSWQCQDLDLPKWDVTLKCGAGALALEALFGTFPKNVAVVSAGVDVSRGNGTYIQK